jgi:hypothetical protein
MRRTLFIAAIMALFFLSSSFDCNCQNKEEWKQKMMSEKIAFLTSEMGITPEEGQVFWPVYNQLDKEKDEAMHKLFHCYRKLSEAFEVRRGRILRKVMGGTGRYRSA